MEQIRRFELLRENKHILGNMTFAATTSTHGRFPGGLGESRGAREELRGGVKGGRGREGGRARPCCLQLCSTLGCSCAARWDAQAQITRCLH
jgi:hypothetical protein